MTKKTTRPSIPVIVQRALAGFIRNETTLRRDTISKMLNPGKDINYECGYPDAISVTDYRTMFDRMGIANRVVKILPQECWKTPPSIAEDEKPEDTKFEEAWQALDDEHMILQYLQRVDILSGIGTFGILLLGLDDGKDLKEPVEGVNEDSGEITRGADRKLLYLKPLDESVVQIKQKDTDVTSPRYSLPTIYEVTFDISTGTTRNTRTVHVHWSRIIHIADGRLTSEITGVPRQEPVFNHLLDLRKLLGASPEMFWKGAYPGLVATFDPKVMTPDMLEDNTLTASIQENLKTEIDKWHNSLQRVLALVGMEVKSLAPQVADPKSNFEVALKSVTITLGIPFRIFVGTEESRLAGQQDTDNWNTRLGNRQNHYLTPMVIRPTIDRFIAFGILPEPKEYTVTWPDLGEKNPKEEAETAKIRAEAIAAYVSSDSFQVMAPKDFFMLILGMTSDEAEAIAQGVNDFEPDIKTGDNSGEQNEPDQA